jgi:hypothetical protein
MSRDPIEESGGLNLYAFVGNDPVNGVDLLGLVGAAVHHWYPLYLGGALNQVGQMFLTAAEHTRVHQVFARLGFGGPSVRGFANVGTAIAQVRWWFAGEAKRRAVIALSMKVSGKFTQAQIDALLPKIMQGARPGMTTTRVGFGIAFGATLTVLTSTNVADASEVRPHLDFVRLLSQGTDSDKDSIPDCMDPNPKQASNASPEVISCLLSLYGTEIATAVEDKYAYIDNWHSSFGIGSPTLTHLGVGLDERKIYSIGMHYKEKLEFVEAMAAWNSRMAVQKQVDQTFQFLSERDRRAVADEENRKERIPAGYEQAVEEYRKLLAEQ